MHDAYLLRIIFKMTEMGEVAYRIQMTLKWFMGNNLNMCVYHYDIHFAGWPVYRPGGTISNQAGTNQILLMFLGVNWSPDLNLYAKSKKRGGGKFPPNPYVPPGPGLILFVLFCLHSWSFIPFFVQEIIETQKSMIW